MDDNEGCVGHAWFLEVLAAGVPFIELLGPVLVSSFGDLEKHKTGYSASRTRQQNNMVVGWSLDSALKTGY